MEGGGQTSSTKHHNSLLPDCGSNVTSCLNSCQHDCIPRKIVTWNCDLGEILSLLSFFFFFLIRMYCLSNKQETKTGIYDEVPVYLIPHRH